MEIGKVPNDILKRLILNKLSNKREEVLLRPKIGEDCCAVDFGENICVLSSDPITGAVNEIGRLAVHVSCNDVASCGVEPLGLLVTILAPAGTTENELEIVMDQLCKTAESLNVDIIGGHTEITGSVNRFVIISTALGKAPKKRLVSTSGARPGDDILVTKSAGLEGAAIIAHEKEKELKEKIGYMLVERAKDFINSISVLKEGTIAGGYGANSMHDVTEGGILGALWEVAEASGVGFLVEAEKIPIAPETREICRYYGIDPLKLISSGCMVITCSDGEGLLKLLNDSGINASIIGKISEGNQRHIIYGPKKVEVQQPGPDELYKVVR